MDLEYIQRYRSEFNKAFDLINKEAIEMAINVLNEARMNGSQIFIIGNGGSASTASHFVCDLAKYTRRQNWPLFRVISLSDNMAIFSAYGNDEGYDNVFREQLTSLLRHNDVVIAFSSSGNSQNLIRAVEYANQSGAKTIAFTGNAGGPLGNLVAIHINVPSDELTIIEDLHLLLEHLITKRLTEIIDLAETGKGSKPSHLPEEINPNFENDIFGKSVVIPGQISLSETLSSLQTFYKFDPGEVNKVDLHNLLENILKVTLESIGAKSGSIAVLDEKGGIVDGALLYGGRMLVSSIDQMAELIQNGLAGWVVENRRGALVTNTKDDSRWLHREWEGDSNISRSVISVPLITHDRVVGVMTLSHPEPGKFTMDDLSLLTAITVAISYRRFGSQKVDHLI